MEDVSANGLVEKNCVWFTWNSNSGPLGVGYGRIFEHKIRLKKANEKNDKMYHKWPICGTFVPQSGEFVPQKWGILLYKCTTNWGT